MYLNSAEWLGKGKRPTVAVIEPQQIESTTPAATEGSIEEDAINPATKEEIPEAVTTPAEEKIPEPVPSLAAELEPTTAAKENSVPIEIKATR